MQLFSFKNCYPLQWRHNERRGVSNHQLLDCLLNRLFRRKPKKTSKLRVTGLCEGNSPMTGEFPAGPVTRKMFPFDDVSCFWRRFCGFLATHQPFHIDNLIPASPVSTELDSATRDNSQFSGQDSKSTINPLSILRPRQNDRHFADDIFKCIFLNENVWILIKSSLKFVPKGPINDIPLVEILAWRWHYKLMLLIINNGNSVERTLANRDLF